jgi:hypothetical protein
MAPAALRRIVLAVLCLAGAGLACARAEMPIEPFDISLATRPPTPTEAGAPAEASATVLPAPATTAAPAAATATLTPPRPTLTRTPAPPPSDTPEPLPTATPAPLAEIPAGAEFTQQFTVSAEGETPLGVPGDLRDGRDITWASLRSGRGAWVFDLGRLQTVAGVRFIAHPDGGDDTTLLGIDLSDDGSAWTTVHAASGTCGEVSGCDVIAQREPVEIAFGPASARYVRLRGGPTRFAIAEIQIAVLP